MGSLVRFYSKVGRRTRKGCRLWRAGKNNKGYGWFWNGTAKVLAHRWIFEADHGYAPPVVRHTCDTPACVELTHLIPGTQADNIRDAVERKRFKRMGPKCKRGHSRWGVHSTTGHRRCLECKRLDSQRGRDGKSR